jgi:polyphosphate kinase 2 (PPK2 family)
VPADGMISVFNRSHYEDVLIVRVDSLVPEDVWRARYQQINQFERLLAESGTTIIKFYLHISAEEQRERFQARIDDPEKHWKFSFEDLEKRKQWPDYMEAYRDALNECNTPWAPWYVIPSDQKWYRNLAVARIIVSHMHQLELAFPEAKAEIGDVVVQ